MCVFSELLETNMTIWMLDHPFYHGFKTDPRQDVRDLYNAEQKITYTFDQYLEASKTTGAHTTDKETHDLQMKTVGVMLSTLNPCRPIFSPHLGQA